MVKFRKTTCVYFALCHFPHIDGKVDPSLMVVHVCCVGSLWELLMC